METRLTDFPAKEPNVFLPAYYSELVRLAEFTKNRNAINYQQGEFKLLSYPNLDQNLVLAEVPDLGHGQLGVFADKDYQIGERIAVYDGIHLTEKMDKEKVSSFCESFTGSGDYIWQVPCDENNSIAIDGRLEGTIARFINHSENHNAEVQYIDGTVYYVATKPIRKGTEITTSYGKKYFEDCHYVKREPAEFSNLFKDIGQEKPAVYVEKMLHENGITLQQKLTEHRDIRTLNLADQGTDHPLFFNQSDEPLVFPVGSENLGQTNLTLNDAVGKEITFTTKENLMIAPLLTAPTGQRIFGLFTTTAILAGTKVCEVKGEDILKQKKVKVDPGKDYIEFKNKYVSFDKKSSEAHFIQGAIKVDANVEIKKQEVYTTKNVKPGELLLAYYGPQYHIHYSPYELTDLLTRLNSAQDTAAVSFSANEKSIDVSILNLPKATGDDMDEHVENPISENNNPTIWSFFYKSGFTLNPKEEVSLSEDSLSEDSSNDRSHKRHKVKETEVSKIDITKKDDSVLTFNRIQ